ncbi:unnamed protein product, partial [marine sediment metagenome]
EAKIITGQTEPEEQAKQLLKCNPEITVIITMGGNGSLVRTKDRIIRASSYKIEVVDGSGGGDAFSAGLLEILIINIFYTKISIGTCCCSKLPFLV